MAGVLDSGKIASRRAKEGKVAVPVRRPQELFVWCEYVAVMIPGGPSFLTLEIVYPVQFSFCAKLVANPNPLIAEKLYRLQYAVVK